MEISVGTYSSVRYLVEVRYWECPLIESPLYFFDEAIWKVPILLVIIHVNTDRKRVATIHTPGIIMHMQSFRLAYAI